MKPEIKTLKHLAQRLLREYWDNTYVIRFPRYRQYLAKDAWKIFERALKRTGLSWDDYLSWSLWYGAEENKNKPSGNLNSWDVILFELFEIRVLANKEI